MTNDSSAERDAKKLSPEEARLVIKAIEEVEKEEAQEQELAKKPE